MPYYGKKKDFRRSFQDSSTTSTELQAITSPLKDDLDHDLFSSGPRDPFEVPFSTRAISYWRASELIGFTLSVRAISEEPGDISLGVTQGDQDESILISGLVTPLKAFSQRYVFRYPARPSAWFSQNLYGVLGTQPFFGPFRGQSSVAAQVVVSIGLRFRAIRTAR